MDQNSQTPNSADRGEATLVRRWFHALRRRPAVARRSADIPKFSSPEVLEIRQVLSATPFGTISSLSESNDVADSSSLSAEEQGFLQATLVQLSHTLQGLGGLNRGTTNSLAQSVDVPTLSVHGNGVITDAAIDLPPLAFDSSLKPNVDLSDPTSGSADAEEPGSGGATTSDTLDEFEVSESTPPAVEDEIDQGSQSRHEVFLDKGQISSSDGQSVPVGEPNVQDFDDTVSGSSPLDVNGPGDVSVPLDSYLNQGDIRVHIQFDWETRGAAVEVHQSDGSTLLITVRSPEGFDIPESRRHILQESISQVTSQLVQSISPGVPVQISMFSSSSLKALNPWDTTVSFLRGVVDVQTGSDLPFDSSGGGSNGTTEVTLNDPSDRNTFASISAESRNSLDTIFENIDSLLFANDSTTFVEPQVAVTLTSTNGASVGSEAVSDPTATSLLFLTHQDLPIAVALEQRTGTGNVDALVTVLSGSSVGSAILEAADEGNSSGDLRQTTRSTSILKLLFAETDSAVVVTGAVAGGTPVVTTTVPSQASSSMTVQAKRNRQVQRDSSAIISLWQEADNEHPPTPQSDDIPREVQNANRSRGPPLIHTARHDLLTDYEAPAGLLERLRYSISPRGPSLVTVDVQLPEILVSFGAES